MTSPADEILSPQTAATHASFPVTSAPFPVDPASPFGDMDDAPSPRDDDDARTDGINGNHDVLPTPDESAKLVDLMSEDVAPSLNGNLANKSAISENGNQNDNG